MAFDNPLASLGNMFIPLKKWWVLALLLISLGIWYYLRVHNKKEQTTTQSHGGWP